MNIRFGVDVLAFDAAAAKVSGRVQLAIARGLNEGGDKVRTRTHRSMLAQTSLLRLNSVTRRSRTIRAFPGAPKTGIGPVAIGTLAYTIVYSGRPTTKPGEFHWKVKKGPGGGVTIRMWGEDHKFVRSFQISTMTGVFGLRMRKYPERLPIRAFRGPNLAKEAEKTDGLVATTFFREVGVIVPPMIAKHLAKLL